MEDVLSATDNFASSKLIGRGGFGLVYKGELSLPEGRIMVAFKRLDRNLGQGNTEFWKEIMMLSKYKHENLISLRNFCIQGDERILVYDYASRGSLDRYLSDANLTWIQRLKICLGVARALDYLHDPMGTQQRLIHRDIKSSNILLDDEWNAKVSDFGLAKVGVANQERTYQVSNAVGTPGYCDPLYYETGLLSKESDVYSFGVVLFEVLCGKLCCEYRNDKLVCILVPTWKKCFAEKRMDDIICRDLKDQINQKSLITFSTIANRCLNRDHTKRPTMTQIVKRIEVALKQCPAINISEQDSAIIASRSSPLNSYGDSSGMMHKRRKSSTSQNNPHQIHNINHQQLSTPSSQPNSGEFDSSELGGDEPARTLKRPRLVWTPQLHKRFVDAVAHLGIKNAVPKTIMQFMSVDGLTRENVASHLQKYRRYLIRMQSMSSGNGGGYGSGGDSATDHLFASSSVPADFLHQGNVNSDSFLPYMPAVELQHQQ